VEAEARQTVAEAWHRLAPEFRVDHQTVGRQEEGCGATIGVMPRCDFGCTGCYLGATANSAEALGLDEIKTQMRLLRQRLGPWGNLQLTDGEVLLRPVEDVVELLQYAREIRLIPMLMTHGDHFRRQPGLLERLMVEGGLVELCIHIDTTQRGRWGAAYNAARHESELMPLRDEFAGMVREARRRTGRPLRVASTVTVTSGNLPEVPEIVAWFVGNADAFRIVSFQPAAQVGRTRAGLGGGVSRDDLWREIARGLAEKRCGAAIDTGNQWWFGHPDCSRLITGLVAVQPGRPNRYELVGMRGEPVDQRFLDGFLRHWGAISFRADTRPQIAARLLGMVRQRPGFCLGTFPRFAWSLVKRLDPERPVRFAGRLLNRRARVHPLSIGSHHFMNAAEIVTPRGRERLDNCIFTVPVDGQLVSMCEVNATGLRDRLNGRSEAQWRVASATSLLAVTVGAS
jgi:molybdenum cofactor biosynthesis enzyme MoaA